MGSTHHSLLYHFVFSTKNRRPYLQPQTRARIFDCLGGTVRSLDSIPIRIGGWVDHAHILAKLKTTHCIADFMRELKSSTSHTFNEQRFTSAKFGWQEGYGVFTVSPSKLNSVTRYIENQEAHHKKETFQDEYLRFLDRHEIEYDPQYIWD